MHFSSHDDWLPKYKEKQRECKRVLETSVETKKRAIGEREAEGNILKFR